MSRLVHLAALALFLSVASSAYAEGRSVGDRRGDVGRRGVLDIASVGHDGGGPLLVHRLTTYRTWSPTILANGGEISFNFDTDGDSGIERRLDVRYAHGRLAAVVETPQGTVIGRGLIRRPSRRTVVVTFARSLLDPELRQYRWFAFAGYGCRHRYRACGDRAPDRRGLITHRLSQDSEPTGGPTGPTGGSTGSTGGSTESTGGSTEPTPIAGQGYHQAFRDDFNTLDRATWDDHIWYDDLPNPAWAGFQQVDANGIFHLRTSRQFTYQGGSYPINTATTLSSGKSFKYGYFEARMQWSAGHGSWPAFWLLSTGWAKTGSCATSAGEIDVMEGQGSEPNVFYGTVHQDSADACEGHKQNGNNWQPLGFDLTTGFHTYGALWTPTSVTWYVDGRQTHSAPTYPDDNQAMFLLLQEWVGGWTFDADSTTPSVIENQVDYVSVWQK